jgi:AAA ATPase domain
VMVRGEAGIGKTRLAGALVELARGDGATVLELSGSPFHVESGFHPIRSLLEQRAGLAAATDGAERLARLRRQLADVGLDADRLVPLLAPVVGLPPAAGYEPAASDARKLHDEIAQAVHDYLVACLAPSPSVLLAEDLHWFDDATRASLDRLRARVTDPLLVVMTARPEVSPPSGIDVLDVGPLSTSESLVLLDTLGLPSTDDAARRALVTRADGVPLYLEELARAAAAGSTTSGDGSAPVAPVGARPPGLNANDAVPDLLYELFVARLYATPTVAPIAAAAATIGGEVDHALLADVVEMSETDLGPALDSLHAEQVLEPDGASRSRFRHELLREVAYELQPPTKRRQLHGRIGDALVRRHAATDVVDWRLVAGHFESAGRSAAAADAFEHAADDARRRGALDEARSNLTRAVENVDGLAAGAARDRREVELRLRRGFLATSMEGNASTSAAADYGRCLSLAGLDAADEEMFRTLIVLWGYFVSRGELERAHQVLTILRPALTGAREFWIPFNTAGFGMIDWYAGRFDRARSQLEAAARDARGIGRDDEVESSWLNPMDPKVSIHTHLALARFVCGDGSGTREAIQEAADRAAALAFPQGPFSAGYVLAFTCWMNVECRNFEAAHEAVTQLMNLATEHGFDHWTLVAVTEQTTLNALDALHAPTPDANALGTHAGMIQGLIAAWDQFDLKAMLPFYWTVLGDIAAAAGDRSAARAHYEASLALAKSTGMHFYDAETLRRAAALSTDASERSARLHDALDTASEQCAHLFELRTALDLSRHDPAVVDQLGAVLRHFPTDASYPELEQARAVIAAGR